MAFSDALMSKWVRWRRSLQMSMSSWQSKQLLAARLVRWSPIILALWCNTSRQEEEEQHAEDITVGASITWNSKRFSELHYQDAGPGYVHGRWMDMLRRSFVVCLYIEGFVTRWINYSWLYSKADKLSVLVNSWRGYGEGETTWQINSWCSWTAVEFILKGW